MHAFDPASTQLRPLAEYSDRIPSSRRGKKLHRATLWRWAFDGVRGGIVLQTARLGGCRYTCDAWIAEFMRAASTADVLPRAQRALPAEDRERIRKEFNLPASVDAHAPAVETK